MSDDHQIKMMLAEALQVDADNLRQAEHLSRSSLRDIATRLDLAVKLLDADTGYTA